MTENTADTQTERETPVELLRRVTENLTSRRDFLGTTAKVGAGGALLTAGAGTAAAGGSGMDGEASSADTAAVTFDDQETTGTSVTVAKVTLPEDGFVAIHDSSLLDGEVLSSVIGVTDYLEAGMHEDVEAMLFTDAVKGADFDMETLEEDDTLIAMPHKDTNDNETYDFVRTKGNQDGPFTDGEDNPVIDDGKVTVVEEMEEDEGDDVSDIDILNYALTLEHLEAAYYNEFLDEYSEQEVESSSVAKVLTGGGNDRYTVYQKIQMVRDHEEAHVEALTQTIEDLGGEPVEPAEYEFPYDSIEEFAALSATIEAVGVSAYAGAAPLIENDDLIPPALAIHSVEARHTSYFNVLNTTNPFPNAFDPARTMEEVLEIASGFIVSE